MPDCPHCGREYADWTYVYTHALQEHSREILTLWEREHGFSSRPTGQQSLSGMVA